MVFGPIQERIYADGGHALDLSNKAFELLDLSVDQRGLAQARTQSSHSMLDMVIPSPHTR